MIFLPMSITSQPSRSCHRRSGRTGTASSFPGCSGRRSGCSWTCCRILGTICPTEMVLYNLEMASQTECNWGNELVRFGRKRSDREETVRSERKYFWTWLWLSLISCRMTDVFSPLLPVWYYWVTYTSVSLKGQGISLGVIAWRRRRERECVWDRVKLSLTGSVPSLRERSGLIFLSPTSYLLIFDWVQSQWFVARWKGSKRHSLNWQQAF